MCVGERERDREGPKNRGWSRERDRAQNRKSMETSIFVEYLKSTIPRKSGETQADGPAGMAFKIFSTSINICSDFTAPLFLHPLLCSPLRLGTPSFTLYLYRPCTRVCSHVYLLVAGSSARFGSQFWIGSFESSSRIREECIVLPNVG